MTYAVIPFDSGNLPASVSQIFGDTNANDLVGNNAGGGFPVISIKGKVFHIVRGGEKTLVTKPGEDDPAGSIEVVVVKANPNRSKVFYATGYVEGTDAKPTCYSNNGVQPEADAQEPQSAKCATCQHNQWGSRITDSGKKGKACSDSRRLAIATVDTPADPMLVRVPAASMKSLEDYGKLLAARGVRPEAVVTRVGFDYTVAHPQLTFKPIGIISDPHLLAEIKTVAESELAAQIVGTAAVPVNESESNADTSQPAAAPTPAPAAAAPAATAAKTSPAAAVNNAMAAAAQAKPVSVRVAAAPAASAPAAPAVNPAVASLESEITGMLDGMDFDDPTQ